MKKLLVAFLLLLSSLGYAQIQLSSNFDVNTALPLDSRTVVADLTARDAIASLVRYEGLIVYVVSENMNYQLVGGTTNTDWTELSGGGSGGGLDQWTTSTVYEVGDVVWVDADKSIYVANTAHTSDATAFSNDIANWDELSNPFTGTNLSVDGNTLSSTDTDGDVIVDANGLGVLDVNSPVNIESLTEYQVPYADTTTANLVGASTFLYNPALDKLSAGQLDVEGAVITPYTLDASVGVQGNGTGSVNVENLNVSNSSILGTEATEDLTITAEATRRVEVEDIIVNDNAISSETVAPLEITSEATQPVNINDVNIQDNAISASVLNDDLPLSGNGTGRVKIDRGGTLYEAGSRNPEYVQLIDDPSFQAGIAEWSCTNATVEQVTNASASNIDHGVDRSATAAKITITADGGYCEIVKTIGTSQAGTYVPSIYYASSSANAFIEFARDSRARVVDELDFINSGDYEFISAQLLASTGLSIRLGGNNTDVIHADMANMELGGYNRSASKNCSGVLDCENAFTGYYDSAEATLADAVKSQTPGQWITNTVKSGASNNVKTMTVSSGVFSQTPKCQATANGNNDHATYDRASSTATSLVFITRSNFDNSVQDNSFEIDCTKAPADYKTTEDQGVTIIPDNKDARLVVTNEGTTTNVAFGATTITVPFDTVKESSLITWDTVNDEGTFQKGGEYRLEAGMTFYNAANDVYPYWKPKIDKGAGYVDLASDNSNCGSFTDLDESLATRLACPFIFSAEKGDKVKLELTSGAASNLLINSNNVYPRMIITPLGGGKAVVENTKRVEFGVEQFFGEYYGGEKVYQYCNEVATNTTTTSTLGTISSGLLPLGIPNYAGADWNVMRVTASGASDNTAGIFYRDTDGTIQGFASGTYVLQAGTVYCLKYRKP